MASLTRSILFAYLFGAYWLSPNGNRCLQKKGASRRYLTFFVNRLLGALMASLTRSILFAYPFRSLLVIPEW